MGDPTLRGAGDPKNILMGAAVADHLLTNARATGVLRTHYSSVTPENVMKWGQIHPQRNYYYWAKVDALVNFAEANDMAIHGHTLLWHTELPSWATAADVESHIKTIVGRYKGRVRSWDVVNEVLSDDGVNLRNTFYGNVDMLVKAFKWAHEADPDAILYINDYNIEDARAKSDRMYALVKELLAKGAPVHGVGFQCHFHTGWTPSEALTVNVKRFAALGLQIHISEFDCAIRDGASLDTQAARYKSMVTAALAAGDKLDKFTTWGFTDASTWLPGQRPLPFDTNYQPKPAVNAMITALGASPNPTTPEEPKVPTPIGGTVKFDQAGPGGDVASNKIIQNALNQEFGGVVIDGDYGPQTMAAYVRWQQSVGSAALPFDGLIGKVSLPPLARKYSFSVKYSTPTTPTEPEENTKVEWVWYQNLVPTPKNGTNSVKIVQRALNSQVGTNLLVDGIFGPITRSAYSKWQLKLWPGASTAVGGDADGLPAKTSLTRLSQAAKFDIHYQDGSIFHGSTGGGSTTNPEPSTPVTTPGKISAKEVLFTRFTGTFDVTEVVKAACKANGYTYTTAWLNGYKTAMGRESGGDPNAANLWDSNAITPAGYSRVADYGNRGTFGPKINGALTPFQCSRGAWQCIPQTFAAYHAPGTSLSIYDPVASCAASMKYVVTRYGVNKDGSNLASRVQQFDSSRPPKGY